MFTNMLMVLLTVFFITKAGCTTTTVNIALVYKSDANLVCNLASILTFYANGLAISIDGSKYILKNSTTLTIKTLRKADVAKNYSCSNSNGDKVIFNTQIAPYFYQVDALSITSTESYSIELACYLIVGGENSQTNTFYWQFNSQTLSSNGRYSIVSDTSSTKLTINNLATTDPGSYYCYVNNTYGSASRFIKLKVKSRLAPLYPFLGCVGQIIFLTIYLFSKWFIQNKDNKLFKKIEEKPNGRDESDESEVIIEKNKKVKDLKRVNFKHETMTKAE